MSNERTTCDECGREKTPMMLISTADGQKVLCKDCFKGSKYSLSDEEIEDIKSAVAYEVSDEEYEEMKELFLKKLEEKGSGYPSDIAEEAGVPFQFHLKIVGDLIEEDRIEKVVNNLEAEEDAE